MTTRPLLLLPPSKGKAPGGDGPAYERTLEAAHPLGEARRTLLAAVASDVQRLDDVALARLAGVPRRDVDAHRESLRDLGGSATLPARRRYTGIVHGNAALADREPSEAIAVRIVSPLLGLAAPDDQVPAYRLELAAATPTLGGLGPWWRAAAADHLEDLAGDGLVWDLLPTEHRRIWTAARRDALDVVDVRFVRPDGRAANAARTKVAKGRLAAAILDQPASSPRDVVARLDLGEGWRLSADGPVLTATSHH